VSKGKPRVVVVDDDPQSRQVIRLLLERQDYETLEAASGEAALEYEPSRRTWSCSTWRWRGSTGSRS
jgi:CheY-like chemotaxis protein